MKKIKKAYFIGIGGIGISAAARILHFYGVEVSGSDSYASEITEQLEREGIKVMSPQRAENVPEDADLICYTVAIAEDHPERQRAGELKIKQLTYPELLGRLMKDHYSIGVSGTNGKTTVTAMLGKIFLEAQEDPTIVIGSKVDYLGGNSRVGKGKYFIFESDEYRRAFINYNPMAAVITYIEADHLDYYKDLADIKSAFSDYLNQIPENGLIAINNDDENSKEAVASCQAKKTTYSLRSEADFKAEEIRVEAGRQFFKVKTVEGGSYQFSLMIPGLFNIYNALAAIAVSRSLGLDWEVISSALVGFKGAWRRFEILGEFKGKTVISDYAHTPDAVDKTIRAAKEFYPGKRILSIFQPHQYNRTKNFFKEFSESFNGADEALLTDIYFVEGRENPKDFDVDSEKLVLAARALGANISYSGDLKSTGEKLMERMDDFDIILLMGAGTVHELAKNICNGKC